ncbi:MAG: tRNA (guanosine(18)-2'-O)-methyltransferase TrmH [Gemmatimonadota bacterium]|nr:tRNA (guanosine(18)-2'-O)-methyltransferase TrmH [Gemmatimonadota bacterium]
MKPERFHRLREVLRRRQPDLTVLMDRVHKPHNVSAILRNCDATGVLDVHVVPPDGGLDLHHHTSAGTKKWVGVQRHPHIGEASRHLEGSGFHLVAAHPGPNAVDFRAFDFTVPTAIVMGAELHGVSDEALEAADTHVVIPMLGMVHSLNVSVATALLLYEAMRQREVAGMYEESRLGPDAFRTRLFEWAYPGIARRLREAGRTYPALDEDGTILRDRG